ncbi:MAG: DUF2442 domain-containing protein [Fimbriimonadaceae bacterium]|nr:DUF2442 domain-containing protein [Fimbriimonadaceae bacterium]
MATRRTEHQAATILTATQWPGGASPIMVVVHPQPFDLDATWSLVVDAPSSRVRELADVIAAARRRRILDGVLIRQDTSYDSTRQALLDLHLTSASRLLVARDEAVRRRVLQAVAWRAQDQLIADAEVIGDALLIRSCQFERLEVPLASLSALRGLDAAQRRQFELDTDGSFLHWPAGDIHLDLEALRLIADPDLAARLRQERVRQDHRLGHAVAAVRASHGLTQAQIEGLSERQVRRIEQGSRPRLSTLERLASAHGLAVDSYLRAVAGAMTAV